MIPPLLEVKRLHLKLRGRSGTIPVLQDLSFSLYPGEIVGLVGESGCGKSLTAAAILGLLPHPHELQGTIQFENQEIQNLSFDDWRRIRGTRLSLILQDPALSLNPLIPIGKQLIEGLCYHKKIGWKAAFEKGVQWLNRVGIPEARSRMQQYPHQMSGGMKQRVLIAMALICQPSLLIADEPTTALDVTVQAQILDLLQRLQKEEKMSILLITHDLAVVAQCCQRVMVMCSGKLVEMNDVCEIFASPQHPTTKTLLKTRYHMFDKRES